MRIGFGRLYAQQDGRLGPRIESLATGLVGTRSVVAIARPYLAELATTIGETAGLSVPEGNTMRYVEQVDSDHPVGVRDWTGARIAMHAVSSGLAVLALWPHARIDAYLAAPLERFTDRTMTDPTELRARLQRIQQEGHAWTSGEYAEGIAQTFKLFAHKFGLDRGLQPLDATQFRPPLGPNGQQTLF